MRPCGITGVGVMPSLLFAFNASEIIKHRVKRLLKCGVGVKGKRGGEGGKVCWWVLGESWWWQGCRARQVLGMEMSPAPGQPCRIRGAGRQWICCALVGTQERVGNQAGLRWLLGMAGELGLSWARLGEGSMVRIQDSMGIHGILWGVWVRLGGLGGLSQT